LTPLQLERIGIAGLAAGLSARGWDASVEMFVPADMIKAPFVVGARVNRTKVLFTTEHNIKRAGFQSGKSGKKRRDFLPQAAKRPSNPSYRSDGDGRPIRGPIRAYKNAWLRWHPYRVLLVLNYIAQPATFWRRRLPDQIGLLDERLHYTMDYEFWLRIGAQHRLHVLKEDLAAFRLHPASKSGGTADYQFQEQLHVAEGLVFRSRCGFITRLYGGSFVYLV
jgi:hypothetical protein